MKFNVLELIGSFNSGGSERQAVQLSRLLQQSGRYRVHVACLDSGGVLRQEVDRLGFGEIPDYPLTSFYDRNAALQLRRFARYLRQSRIDLVHTHDFYTNIFGMAGAWLAGVPARVASRRESAMRSPAQRFVERCSYRMARAVIANCEEVRQQLIAEGVSAGKVVTVHNGLDMDRVSPRPDLTAQDKLALLGLPADGGRRFVTILANLRLAMKDHPTFLRAASRVREAVPDSAFIVAGEGELMAPLREYAAQLGIEKQTFFIGRCQHVAELLAISEVCVLSSRAEGFSNSILEYMAAARPVVATDVGGAREAVIDGHNGYLIEAGDDVRMAERIASLLLNPEQARVMGGRGRDIVAERFSSRKQLERIENLYDRLLTRAKAPMPQPLGSVRREGA